MRGLSAVRNAGADHRGRELRACCDPDAAIVEEGAFALFGGEDFLIGGIEDETRHELAFALEGDRDRKNWNAVQEIGGAVEWIDDPAMAAIAPFDIAALLHQEAVAWTRAGKFGDENLLGAVVRGADEIGRTFERDLKLLDLAEIARETAARLAGGGEHHIHQRRGGHGTSSVMPAHAGNQ